MIPSTTFFQIRVIFPMESVDSSFSLSRSYEISSFSILLKYYEVQLELPRLNVGKACGKRWLLTITAGARRVGCRATCIDQDELIGYRL
jgi:hypothetical protein